MNTYTIPFALVLSLGASIHAQVKLHPDFVWTDEARGPVAIDRFGTVASLGKSTRSGPHVRHALQSKSIRSWSYQGFSPDQLVLRQDGKRIAARNRVTRIFDVTNGSSWSLNVSSNAVGLDFHPDGRVLVPNSSKGTAELWDYTTSRMQSFGPNAKGEPLYSVALSKDGKRIAIASGFSGSGGRMRVHLYATSTGKQLAATQFSDNNGYDHLRFSPDGRVLVAGSSNSSLRVLATADLKQVARVSASKLDNVRSVEFSGDGRLLALAGSYNNNPYTYGRVEFVDASRMAYGRVRHIAYYEFGKRIESLKWSGNSQLMIASYYDTKARVGVIDSPFDTIRPGRGRFVTSGTGCKTTESKIPSVLPSVMSLGRTSKVGIRETPQASLGGILAMGRKLATSVDLGNFGMPACRLYVMPDITFFVGRNQTISFSIPKDSGLIGVVLPTQGFVFDARLNSRGMAATNLAEFTIGR